ncbi:MAG: multiprotein-bridging factor 1 family protein [Candidatus Micrarchaeota archaeon]
MASCDICGRPAGLRAVVEGAEMDVCSACSRYGKLLNMSRDSPSISLNSAPLPQQQEIELVNNYGKLIFNVRNALGLSLEELGRKLNIREKDLLHFEEEKAKPTEKDVAKIGAFLRINLLKNVEVQEQSGKKAFAKGLTLGDVVVIKDKRAKK